MISSLKEDYFKILKANEGPYIQELGKVKDLKEEDKQGEEYVKRLENDIKDTLKEKS